MILVDKTTLVERLFHCDRCEHKRGQGFTARCDKCGCVIQGKTRFAGQSCPIGKWPSVGGEPAPETKQTQEFKPGSCCGGQ